MDLAQFHRGTVPSQTSAARTKRRQGNDTRQTRSRPKQCKKVRRTYDARGDYLMGGAKNPVRRKMTAAAAAEKFGASTRTIQRLFAEPRDDYLGRAKARRDKAVELRKQGLKYREIAEAMRSEEHTSE